MRKEPRVGVGVLIFRNGDVLVGKRLGSHGSGEFALPGGHLEFGESWENCARREVEEETGLQLSNVRFETAVNSVFEDTAHYVTIFMRGEADQAAEAKVLEPDKCEGWVWVPWPSIPQPVFLPLQLLQDSGYDPFAHASQPSANRPGSSIFRIISRYLIFALGRVLSRFLDVFAAAILLLLYFHLFYK